MPTEAFSQRPVEPLYDALVPVDINPTAPSLDRMLRQQLTDGPINSRKGQLEGASATAKGSACKSGQGYRRPLPQSC